VPHRHTVVAPTSPHAVMNILTQERRRLVLFVVGSALLSAMSGCRKGDGIERLPLSGSVSFRGESVVDGQIRFVPKPGTAAPLTITTIGEGRYDTASLGGVPVGQFRVEIRAFDPKTPAPQFPGDPQRTQLLPAKFNAQSVLELTVESGQTNLQHDFQLSP
jgi:hypothetical protein